MAAARTHFATDGYAASLRTIAASAGVDPGLIRHFFGSKDLLFAAVLVVPDDALQHMQHAVAGDPDLLGERITRAYLHIWEQPETAEPLVAIARTALASQQTAEHLRDLIAERLLNLTAPELRGNQREVRVALLSAQLMGVALTRYVLRAGPLADLDREALVALISPTVQHHLTQE